MHLGSNDELSTLLNSTIWVYIIYSFTVSSVFWLIFIAQFTHSLLNYSVIFFIFSTMAFLLLSICSLDNTKLGITVAIIHNCSEVCVVICS